MLRLANLSLPLSYTEAHLAALICRKLRIAGGDLTGTALVKKSVDARDKGDVHFVLTVDAAVRDEAEVLKRVRGGTAVPAPVRRALTVPQAAFREAPVVVGAGPAGLFAALTLARAGARPVLLERGKPVDERRRDVERMRGAGVLNPESNVQFGEGGAGAFSDGKLTTGIKSPWQAEVLATFVRFGAPEEILYLQKPHIGTDLLTGVVASMRREIIALGGRVLFETRLSGLILRNGRVRGVRAEKGGIPEEISTDTVVLAIGHSARDTLEELLAEGVRMEQKPFAVGLRIEHRQSMINAAQYGACAGHPALPAADYKLAVRTADGRGAYTFCMCPGGEVIAAASEAEGLAVNGMSLHARSGDNANAALLVGVRPGDFGNDAPLAGIAWQRSLEQAAFRLGGGNYRAPVQRVEDFLARRATVRLGDVTPTYRPGVALCDLNGCLPEFVAADLRTGILQMDRQLHGFAHPDAVLTGVETRSSSPVRLPRADNFMAGGIDGLFPAGEGAGYAGGIISAAVDGISAALAAIERSRA